MRILNGDHAENAGSFRDGEEIALRNHKMLEVVDGEE